MKNIGERSVLSKLKSQWQVVPVFLSGIILIMLLISDLHTPTSPTSSVLYIEYLLSFVASFILFFWILSPIYYLFKRRNDGSIMNIMGYLFYFIYTLVLLVSSPFALLSIRFFLQDEKYIKNISILTIVSTLFSLYYTFGVATH
jgi:uncharacterized membrane protein HdeD (DUF308 family)